MRATTLGGVLAAALLTLALTAAPAEAAGSRTNRVSYTNTGHQSNGDSNASAVSGDGRYVAFVSFASNLVAGDTNGLLDLFLRDRQAGTTKRISVSSQGAQQTTGIVGDPDISSDGRYVVFSSDATELAPGGVVGQTDIYVRDTVANTTRRVSVGLGGADADGGSASPRITPDGKYVVFSSAADNLVAGDTNGFLDIFVVTLATGAAARASLGVGGQANGPSFEPVMSANGRYVAFESAASNLVAGDIGSQTDVFVRDLVSAATRRVSEVAGVGGNEISAQPAISADGRFVAYGSSATNLVPGDTNDSSDVFLWDRTNGSTKRVSVGPQGVQGGEGSGLFNGVGISYSGRYISFTSAASNLVADDTNSSNDVFVYDATTGIVRRVSVSTAGGEGNHPSFRARISVDGRHVSFVSQATTLVANDTNGFMDIFVRDN